MQVSFLDCSVALPPMGPRVMTALGSCGGTGLEIPPSPALGTTRDCSVDDLSAGRVSLLSSPSPACFLNLELIPPFFFLVFLYFLGLHPQHMEVPRLGV